jgi:hypothetical protein
MKKVMAGALVAALALLVALAGFWPAGEQQSARAQDPFPTPTLEWSWDGSGLASQDLPNSNQVMMAPVVADVTGPGHGPPDGIPDVIFTTFDPSQTPGEYIRHGVLRIVSGDGTYRYSITGTSHALVPIGGIAVADIDNDGRPEIVGIRDDQEGTDCNRVMAFDGPTGNAEWIGGCVLSGPPYTYCAGPTIADVDADGGPDIVVGNCIRDFWGNEY